MAEFNAAHALRHAAERNDQMLSGEKVVPVLAAVVAVLAATATLFANHRSISALAQKNEAIVYLSKSADQYNYYESKRIKIIVNSAFLSAGLNIDPAHRASMTAQLAKDQSQTPAALKKAQEYQAASDDHMGQSERFMASYEKHEVAATLFEVSIVLISITALTRTRVLLMIAIGATLVGVGFFLAGLLL